MKSILQKILVNTLAILIASSLIGGLTWGSHLSTLLLASLVLALVNAFIRPFLKILFLPINVITLGLFGWVINVIVLYLTTLIVPGFHVIAFSLTLGSTTFVLNHLLAYIVVSFLLNILTTFTSWLITP
jgi:putative membrane protein